MTEKDECPIVTKCAKLNGNNKEENGDGIPPALKLLRSLKPSRVLNNRSHDKFMAILATNTDQKDGIMLLEKTPFNDDIATFGDGWVEDGEQVMQNDVYSKLKVRAANGMGDLKVTIINPCTERMITRYERQTIHLLAETKEKYQTIVQPYVEKTRHSLTWVHNILNGTAEQDRVILSDPDPDTGFVLSADLKWDGVTTEDMYCLTLVRRTDLASMRDLGTSHLPLLRNIGSKGREALAKKLNVAESELRVFFHYPPSFYHLHVHFTHISNMVAGSETERAHLLDTVINNIEMMPDYYQRATLTINVRERDELYGLMTDK